MKLLLTMYECVVKRSAPNKLNLIQLFYSPTYNSVAVNNTNAYLTMKTHSTCLHSIGNTSVIIITLHFRNFYLKL